jgi:sialic acid synthase SpsE
MAVKFIADIGSNHAQDVSRAQQLIVEAAAAGCDAVKCQLFRLGDLFAPEVLAEGAGPGLSTALELPPGFLAALKLTCGELGLEFGCSPSSLGAVGELEPSVDFFKIGSFDLLRDDLLREVGATAKPVTVSTGMATMPEIRGAILALGDVGARDIMLMHCVSAYPAPGDQANLAAIETIRSTTGLPTGWSDHTRDPAVIERAVHRWGACAVEFHIDLDGQGPDYGDGHCWLPEEIAPVIERIRRGEKADGRYMKAPTQAELANRAWRADPEDGFRPSKEVRAEWTAPRAVAAGE